MHFHVIIVGTQVGVRVQIRVFKQDIASDLLMGLQTKLTPSISHVGDASMLNYIPSSFLNILTNYLLSA